MIQELNDIFYHPCLIRRKKIYNCYKKGKKEMNLNPNEDYTRLMITVNPNEIIRNLTHSKSKLFAFFVVLFTFNTSLIIVDLIMKSNQHFNWKVDICSDDIS